MALVLKDRVKETTTTTSTGTYTLAGAVTGYQSFSVVGDGNTTYYTVTNGTDWEVGIGTYTSSGTTLSRDTILASSNSGNAVSWGAGSKDVFLTYPAERSVYVDGAEIVPATSASYSGNVTTIQLRYSSTPGSVPTGASLSAGELVVNTADGKLYFKNSSGTVQVLAQINQATTNGAETLTNKRIDPRVSSTASTSAITPDISAYDQYVVTAQAAALQINAPIGTPVDGNKLIFRILDNGTSRALTWNGTYTAIGVTIPTATTVSKMTYVGCIYNAANTRWDVVAVTTQA